MIVRVQTFNVLRPTPGLPSWRRRLDAAATLLEAIDPDLLGTQEGTPQTLRAFDRVLPGHARIGTGRDAANRDLQSAIFYRKDRFTVLDAGHFWLSRTPDIPGSPQPGPRWPRVSTWAHLQDRSSGQTFTWVNTHFGHTFGRDQASILVRCLSSRPRPWIITGDFNAWPGSPAHVELTRNGHGILDAWEAARERSPRGATWHAYTGRAIVRFDWVLCTPPLEVARVTVRTDCPHGIFPSDHFPIVADLEWD